MLKHFVKVILRLVKEEVLRYMRFIPLILNYLDGIVKELLHRNFCGDCCKTLCTLFRFQEIGKVFGINVKCIFGTILAQEIANIDFRIICHNPCNNVSHFYQLFYPIWNLILYMIYVSQLASSSRSKIGFLQKISFNYKQQKCVWN